MTEADKPAFATLMIATAELYNRNLSPSSLNLQFLALSHLSLAQIRAALTEHVRSKPFFPMAVELIDAIEGSGEDRAELAWTALVQMVRRCGSWWDSARQGPLPWPDEATKRAALEMYGGWQRLCENLPAAGPEFLGAAKHFKALFCAQEWEDRRGHRDALIAHIEQIDRAGREAAKRADLEGLQTRKGPIQ